MRQYFYLVLHDSTVDKVFLQEHDAIRWGRQLATRNPEYSVRLYKQEITRTGTLKFVKELIPYDNKVV